MSDTQTMFSRGFNAARVRHTRGLSLPVLLAYVLPLEGAEWREGVAAYVDMRLGVTTARTTVARSLGLS